MYIQLSYNENKPKKIRILRNPFLYECYENDYLNCIVHVNRYLDERSFLTLYNFKNSYATIDLLKLFCKYKSELYFSLFYKIENREIDRRLGAYFNSTKRRISSKDHKWLINKICYIDEIQISKNKIKNDNNWICYRQGKKNDEHFLQYPKTTLEFQRKYRHYLNYINSINVLQYNSVLLWITFLTLLISIITLLLTLFCS